MTILLFVFLNIEFLKRKKEVAESKGGKGRFSAQQWAIKTNNENYYYFYLCF